MGFRWSSGELLSEVSASCTHTRRSAHSHTHTHTHAHVHTHTESWLGQQKKYIYFRRAEGHREPHSRRLYWCAFKHTHTHTLPFFFFFPFIFISWRLITLQYCSHFCHTLTWISHGFTCVPHPDPPSRLPFPFSLKLFVDVIFDCTGSLLIMHGLLTAVASPVVGRGL